MHFADLHLQLQLAVFTKSKYQVLSNEFHYWYTYMVYVSFISNNPTQRFLNNSYKFRYTYWQPKMDTNDIT